MDTKLTVAVDGGPLFRAFDGVGRYAANMLINVAYKDPGVKYVVVGFSDDRAKTPLVPATENISYVYLPFPRRLYQVVFKFLRPIAVDRWLGFKPDVALHFNFVRTPLIKSVPSVTVIHDLAYLDTPQYVEPKNRHYLKKFVPWSVAGSKVVVAVSEFTRGRLLNVFDNPAPNVRVVPNAVDNKFLEAITADQQTALRQKYRLPPRFMLYLGTIEPRKNIDNILAAAALQDYPLVLAGAMGWNISPVTRQKIAQLQAEGKLLALGHFANDELPTLYSLADVFVWPTLYEGFGLPQLEAMAVGTPVVGSDIEPSKSLVGEAGIMVDPKNPGAIADALEKVLVDDDLRARLSAAGRERAKSHTWEASADLLYDVLQEAAKP